MFETEAFIHAQKRARRATLGEVFREHGREVMCGLGAVIALTVTVYVLIGYLPTFAVKQLKSPFGQSFTALIVGNLLLTVLSPVAGAWSDRIGRKGLSLWSLIITLVIIYPLFAWLSAEPSVTRLIIVQGILSVTLAGYYGPFSARCWQSCSRAYPFDGDWSIACQRRGRAVRWLWSVRGDVADQDDRFAARTDVLRDVGYRAVDHCRGLHSFRASCRCRRSAGLVLMS